MTVVGVRVGARDRAGAVREHNRAGAGGSIAPVYRHRERIAVPRVCEIPRQGQRRALIGAEALALRRAVNDIRLRIVVEPYPAAGKRATCRRGEVELELTVDVNQEPIRAVLDREAVLDIAHPALIAQVGCPGQFSHAILMAPEVPLRIRNARDARDCQSLQAVDAATNLICLPPVDEQVVGARVGEIAGLKPQHEADEVVVTFPHDADHHVEGSCRYLEVAIEERRLTVECLGRRRSRRIDGPKPRSLLVVLLYPCSQIGGEAFEHRIARVRRDQRLARWSESAVDRRIDGDDQGACREDTPRFERRDI